MPSTSKKQHNFMAAIANNPSFAKKVGVPQSVGKDFSAADKGKKFGRGGMAAINKQDTQHGSMDMPFKSLKKFGGMKFGGKVKRYAGEEGSEVYNDDNRPFAETKATEERTTTRNVPAEPSTPTPTPAKSTGSANFKSAFAAARSGGEKTFDYGGKSYSTDLAKPSKDHGDESARMLARAPRKETVTETIATPAVTGRADKVSKNMPSDAQKEATSERIRNAAMAAGFMLPAGKVVSGISTGVKAINAARAAKTAGAMEKVAAGTAKQVSAKKEAAKEAAYDARRARDMEAGFKKGGMAHGGMHKMPDGKMMKNSAMKMGGMPIKDGKPAFLMGKKMNMGGMAKYAKGGGIESKGKTKGTVIKMASGGSVSSASRRADGIAQRGKTRC